MALSGHSQELSLPDLIQANALGRNTCRILVATPEGKGVLYLEDGTVIHASYGNLSGREAFFVLMATDNAFFHVESGLSTVFRTVQGNWQGLLMEAMQLRDEGRLPKPVFAQTHAVEDEDARNVRSFPRIVPPVGAPQAAPSRQHLPTWAVVAGALLLAGGAAVGALALKEKAPGKAPAQETVPAAVPVEASSLGGPADVQPRLVSGPQPPSPDPGLAVRPTIVCRILVDEQGHVREASIYRSRLDLAAFEDAALDAARRSRFTPALKGGRPVPVWLNWPVSFQ
ncbi:MAG: TonB family protein [Thermoanaerobaculaceae bacterium]|jgi:protein TonB|nr:TonB family protein [Thermoanaerobaculaceae bacterium]